ncbi:MAG: bifunctional phosphopantothenoylcysteine decarboxylase/phosphopantothenate--cysteine ligase CoaBC [Gammaproteobacteria bacterium]|nr:MAG: bifunctional phosphopantothenoylcysteine decarboxylase/phosphopantothenate--cysteine ligase CoaBC [Gammaproteobacteria bacterium]
MAGRRVVLGVTGGIAAYKTVLVARELVKAGADVQVVLSRGAHAFVTPMTFQAITGRPVRDSVLDAEAEQGMSHIELARWAEVMLIAPATANCIAKLAAGLADDLLGTLVLASTCPILIAPAMNQAMWHNPLTQRNLKQLLDVDPRMRCVGPDEGEQACGDIGAGRMVEPEQLVEAVRQVLARASGIMAGQHVVITAGPTREPIDPVRYISNHSSGKMGYALARAAREAGARVTLVSGPVQLSPPPGVDVVRVETAEEMLAATRSALEDEASVFIASAAVADYRVATPAEHKLKKEGAAGGMHLTLVENPDILATLAHDFSQVFSVGFAAETRDVVTYARRKLARKGARMIVANDVSQPGIGFNADDNQVTLVFPEGEEALPRMSKTALAHRLIETIAQSLKEGRHT